MPWYLWYSRRQMLKNTFLVIAAKPAFHNICLLLYHFAWSTYWKYHHK